MPRYGMPRVSIIEIMRYAIAVVLLAVFLFPAIGLAQSNDQSGTGEEPKVREFHPNEYPLPPLPSNPGNDACGPIKFQRGVKHYNRGLDLERKGDLDAAIEEYRMSITECSSFWRPSLNLAVALEDKGDLDEAVTQYRTVIGQWPKNVLAHFDLGTALEHKGDLDGAIAEYRTSIGRQQKFPEAHYRLGHALQAQGDIDEAIAEYRTAVRQRPNYPEAESAIAEALKAKGKS